MYPPTTETYTYCNPLSHHAALPCSFPADIRPAGPLQDLLHAQRPAKPEPRSQATRPGPAPPAAGLTEGSPEGAAADHWPAPAGHQQDPASALSGSRWKKGAIAAPFFLRLVLVCNRLDPVTPE